jgi:hypothetical protein
MSSAQPTRELIRVKAELEKLNAHLAQQRKEQLEDQDNALWRVLIFIFACVLLGAWWSYK